MATIDIVTFGSAVRDVTFCTKAGRIFNTPEDLTSQKMLAFEFGAKIHVTDSHKTQGGGATNAAVSFERLGLHAAACIRVGDDHDGLDIKESLRAENVDVKMIQRDDAHDTGLSFIIMADKRERDRTIFFNLGANEHLTTTQLKASRVKPQWVYVASLYGGQWEKNIKNIFQYAHRSKARIAWNPGQAQLKKGYKALRQYLEKTTILSLNKDEAIELVLSGITVGSRNPAYLNKPKYLLNILHEWGPDVVVITEGKKGAWIYDGTTMHHQKIRKAKVVDTTGVGDAFGSTFVSGYHYTNDIETAAKWAMVNTASVVQKVGAQNGLLTKKEITKKVT